MNDYGGYSSYELDALRKAIDAVIFAFSCPQDGGCPGCRVRDDCEALFNVMRHIVLEINSRDSLERIGSYGEEKDRH